MFGKTTEDTVSEQKDNPVFLIGGVIMKTNELKSRKHILAKRIGEICKKYRISMKLKVIDISRKTGYSTQLIYQFESGNTTNMIILFDCYFDMLDTHNQVQLLNDIVNATMW